MYKHLLALAAGSLLVLAFAPFGYHLVAIIALSGLLLLWHQTTPKQAFTLGFLFGIGFFGSGIWWVYISMHQYGNAPVALAMVLTSFLVSFLATFIAVTGYLLNRFFSAPSKFFALAPIWTLTELLRSWLFTGFPWLLLGSSQIDSPLANYAPLLGVYGVSFIVCLLAGCLAMLITKCAFRTKIIILLVIVTSFLGGLSLATINWTHPAGNKIKVTIVQGNIPLTQKWHDQELSKILKIYQRLSARHWESQIIIWPEAAIPVCPQAIPQFLQELQHTAQAHHTTIITGIPLYEPLTNKYYNGLITLGAHPSSYRKRHLVPFGEYMPGKALLSWLHNYITIPMSDFSPGPKQAPIVAGATPIAPFICYEIAYPNLYMPNTQLLVTISEDSWFGKSLAMAQHLEIARMRSLETGRYQAISTNTGISAIINANGKILAQTQPFTRTTLTAEVYPMLGTTPWSKMRSYLHP